MDVEQRRLWDCLTRGSIAADWCEHDRGNYEVCLAQVETATLQDPTAFRVLAHLAMNVSL